MPLPASGPISMSQMNTEFAKGTSLSQYYSTASHPPHLWRMNIVIPSHGDNRANVPSSGSISFSDYYNKRQQITKNFGTTPHSYTSWVGSYTFVKQSIYEHRFTPYWSLYGFAYSAGVYSQIPGFTNIISTGGGLFNNSLFQVTGTSFTSNCMSAPIFLTYDLQVDATANSMLLFQKYEYLQNGTITYDPGTNGYFDKLNKSASSGLGSSTYAGPEISPMYISSMETYFYDTAGWGFTPMVYVYNSYSGNCPVGTGSNQHNDLTPDSINLDAWFSYLSTRQVIYNGASIERPDGLVGNRYSRNAMSQSGQQTTNFRGYSFSFAGQAFNPAHSPVFSSVQNISFNGTNYVFSSRYSVGLSGGGTNTNTPGLNQQHFRQVH